MASINGIAVKGVTTFKDHEGATIAQGNVYIDGKKAGFWSQDSWGGPDEYEPMELRNKIEERAKCFKEGCPTTMKYVEFQGDPDILMNHILNLADDEKTYKKYVKKGYPIVIYATDGYHYTTCAYSSACKVDDIRKEMPKIQANMTKGFFKNSEISVYIHDSLQSFNVVCDNTHPAGERFTQTA